MFSVCWQHRVQRSELHALQKRKEEREKHLRPANRGRLEEKQQATQRYPAASHAKCGSRKTMRPPARHGAEAHALNSSPRPPRAARCGELSQNPRAARRAIEFNAARAFDPCLFATQREKR